MPYGRLSAWHRQLGRLILEALEASQILRDQRFGGICVDTPVKPLLVSLASLAAEPLGLGNLFLQAQVVETRVRSSPGGPPHTDNHPRQQLAPGHLTAALYC